MAHPGNVPSSILVYADWLDPDNRVRGLLEDYELGGVDISDPSLGLQWQVWHLTWDDDIESPNYGDFVITGERNQLQYTIINVASVANCGFAFDQNMRPAICYELENGNSYYYWYDSDIPGFTTSQLPADSSSPRMCLDDHRERQSLANDIILGYIRAGDLYYRQQRDRFTIERLWAEDVTPPLNVIGMAANNRVIYNTGALYGVALCEIEASMMDAIEFSKYDLTELCAIPVRGFLIAGMYTVADAIRSLQRVYFHDMPEIDGLLRGILRGSNTEATVYLDDMVVGGEVDWKTRREQGIEFPRKLHVSYTGAESDYANTKATSERRDPTMKERNEIIVESPVNHTPQDATERAEILHTIAWNEREGIAEFKLDYSWWFLCPGTAIILEVSPGVMRRVRITEMTYADGVFELKAVRERASTYTNTLAAVAPYLLPPTAPAPSIPGETTWSYLDIPGLLTEHDSLHYYVAARGDANTGWRGAKIQRFIGSDWINEGDVTSAETMGTVEQDVGNGNVYIIDTTNKVRVSLNKAPESVTIEDMYSGRGAWVIGDEIIQVRDWVEVGTNLYEGSHLFRGRLDTPVSAHEAGEQFVFLGNPVRIPLDSSILDTSITLRAVSYGSSTGPGVVVPFTGKSQEEWPPEMLTWEKSGNDWIFSWVPRLPLGSSVNPVAHSNWYGWRFRFNVGGTIVQRDHESRTATFTYTEAMQTADFGSAQASFTSVELRGMNFLGGEGKALTENSVS